MFRCCVVLCFRVVLFCWTRKASPLESGTLTPSIPSTFEGFDEVFLSSVPRPLPSPSHPYRHLYRLPTPPLLLSPLRSLSFPFPPPPPPPSPASLSPPSLTVSSCSPTARAHLPFLSASSLPPTPTDPHTYIFSAASPPSPSAPLTPRPLPRAMRFRWSRMLLVQTHYDYHIRKCSRFVAVTAPCLYCDTSADSCPRRPGYVPTCKQMCQ